MLLLRFGLVWFCFCFWGYVVVVAAAHESSSSRAGHAFRGSQEEKFFCVLKDVVIWIPGQRFFCLSFSACVWNQ